VIVWWALFSLIPSISRGAATPITLKVKAVIGLPEFNRTELSRFIASRMAEANFTDWRFEAAEDDPGPDRAEWRFKRNRYPGVEVRRFGSEGGSFHARRPIKIEARLYLNGENQVTVEKQAKIDEASGRADPQLAEAVASVTQNLLRPSGVCYAIDLGHHPASGAR
jgi:hypothetical protein